MKTARLRSLVLYIVLGGFLAGMIFFVACFFFQGGDWAMRPSNQHLDGTSQLSNAGVVTDRNGTVIAYSDSGQRFYNEDYATRCALLHVLGDTNGYISTGVQSTSLTKLTGYNPVMGLMGNSGGADMKLTVSAGLSALTLQEFNGRKGAAVLYNYKTGEVLCMVSSPTFDPLYVPEDMDNNPSYNGVFLNKGLSSTFTPGSTFKVVTTACALQYLKNADSWTYECSGETVINGNRIICDSHSAHGTETIQDALTNSCNCAFAHLALELGKDNMNKTAKALGFNQKFKVDDNYTAESHFSVDGKTTDDGLGWSGIGQYTDTANPTHMMILMGAIANEGVPTMPYLIQSASGYTGHGKSGSRMMDANIADQLKTMMRNNVINGYGDNLFPGMAVCAKTGTAEVDDSSADTGWIVGFSQNEETPYAFAVVVEEGGYGLSSAGYIASSMMNYMCY